MAIILGRLIIDTLCTMRAVKRPRSFQFDEDGLLHQKIDKVFTDQGAFINEVRQ